MQQVEAEMHALESGGVGSLDELELFGGGGTVDPGGDAGGGKHALGLDPTDESKPKAGLGNSDSGGSDDSSSSGSDSSDSDADVADSSEKLGNSDKLRSDSVDIAPNMNAWSSIGNGVGQENPEAVSSAGQADNQSNLWLAAQSQTSLKRQREQEIADKVTEQLEPFSNSSNEWVLVLSILRKHVIHKHGWQHKKLNEHSYLSNARNSRRKNKNRKNKNSVVLKRQKSRGWLCELLLVKREKIWNSLWTLTSKVC